MAVSRTTNVERRNRQRGAGPRPIIRRGSDVSRVSCPHGQGNRGPQHRGSRGHDHEPGKVYFPETGAHQARPRPLLPGRRRRRAARHPATGRSCSSASSTAPTGSRSTRSARRESRPSGSGPSTLSFPSGRTAEEIVVDDAARPGLDRQPRLHRAASRTRCAPTTSTTPTSCASTSTPCPGVAVGRRPRASRSDARGSLEELGLVGWPEDSRLARHARQRAHRAALDVHRGAPRGAGAGARGRAARARRSPPPSGGRRSATASSSTTTRTPRTAPPPRPTRCGRCPTRASRRR